MNFKHIWANCNFDLIFEALAWLVLILIQMSSLRGFLAGERTLTHDNVISNFPVFINYFRELAAGHLPVYNFLSRFGEPFVPTAAQMRLWDPLQTLLGIGLWELFSDKVRVFNWLRVVVTLLQSLGIYLLFRPLAPSKFAKFILINSLLFSSMFFGSFHQDGILSQFLWVPWILWIWRSGFLEGKTTLFLSFTLGLLIGCSFQSYFFVIPLFFLAVFTGFWWLCVARPRFLSEPRAYLLPILVFVAAVLPMGTINVFSLAESRSWKFPMRSAIEDRTMPLAYYPKRALKASGPDSLSLNKELIRENGASSQIWDFVFLFSPRANIMISHDPATRQGEPSEAFIYFGLFPLLLGLLGIAYGQGREKLVWLNVLSLFLVMSFGPAGLLYLNLITVLPFLGLVRNTHCLIIYVELAFLYFIVLGAGLFERKCRELLLA